MPAVNCPEFPILEHTIQLRVRYQETDGQGRLHHANYINYFEVGRVELLRAAGFSYKELEENGIQLVVIAVQCEYVRSVGYDDVVSLTTRVTKSKGVRIEHEYVIEHEGEIVATGSTIVAAVGTDGKVKRLPAWLRIA
ncbi:MAG TPA: thioesterase family protein [Pirellulaceae bacterium]|nr:thioesterase family protein [Pirellulaceae bacterium]HMO90731.1 thioesterase family protein [Pirellulaceae bacterium]HMP67982.1 thioesterase family protein [Pirellulaceae bacterium]